MANNALLISTASPTKPPFGEWKRGRKSELLIAANDCIPLFWYMLFDEEAIVRSEPPEDEEVGEGAYAALTKTSAEALALARSRWTRVRLVLGTGTDDLFQRWSGFVEANARAYIHCETWEWSWLFKGSRAFESHLRTCLRAFAHVPRLRKEVPALNKWWRELLGQCAVIDRRSDDIHPLGEFSYCGYSWSDYVVPWDETAP